MAEFFLRVGCVARIAQHMDCHWWSAAVQEAGTDALIALIPRRVMQACSPKRFEDDLEAVLRAAYGKLSGAHVAVGVLRVVQRSNQTRNQATASRKDEASWTSRKGGAFDAGHSDDDDDDNLYLLGQRLVGYSDEVWHLSVVACHCDCNWLSMLCSQLHKTMQATEEGIPKDARFVRARSTPRPYDTIAAASYFLVGVANRSPTPFVLAD